MMKHERESQSKTTLNFSISNHFEMSTGPIWIEVRCRLHPQAWSASWRSWEAIPISAMPKACPLSTRPARTWMAPATRTTDYRGCGGFYKGLRWSSWPNKGCPRWKSDPFFQISCSDSNSCRTWLHQQAAASPGTPVVDHYIVLCSIMSYYSVLFCSVPFQYVGLYILYTKLYYTHRHNTYIICMCIYIWCFPIRMAKKCWVITCRDQIQCIQWPQETITALVEGADGECWWWMLVNVG